MSTLLQDLDKYKFEYNLNVINPPLSYVNQENVDRFSIALCLEIPYPLLRYWGKIADKKDTQGKSLDYLDLLNSWIPGKWFQISRATGFRIQGRLRREVGSITNRYKKINNMKKKRELDDKKLSLSILTSELVNIKCMEGQLEQVSQVMMEWQQKYVELDKEKESLAQEMVQALENKEQLLETINK